MFNDHLVLTGCLYSNMYKNAWIFDIFDLISMKNLSIFQLKSLNFVTLKAEAVFEVCLDLLNNMIPLNIGSSENSQTRRVKI